MTSQCLRCTSKLWIKQHSCLDHRVILRSYNSCNSFINLGWRLRQGCTLKIPLISEASEKWWSWLDTISIKSADLKQQSIINCDSLGTSESHICLCARCSIGTSSSQPKFILHKSCRIFLPINMEGATKPNGSKTESTTKIYTSPSGGFVLEINVENKCVVFYPPLNTKQVLIWQLILSKV